MGHLGDTAVGVGGNFATLWSPALALILIVMGWLYGLTVHRWRHQFTDSSPVGAREQFYFYSGLLLFYVAEGSPLSYYAHHYSFSAHMLQQSISYLIVPPLLLLGTPGWLLRSLFQHAAMQRLINVAASPLVALFVFNFIFSFYHIPMVMDTLMTHPLLHFMYNIIFLLAAFQMWFPVFCPLPEYNKISDLRKMGYIFINGILLTPACALIIFAGKPLYDSYANVPESYLLLTLVNDQQLGGVIMKIVQEIVYGIALGYVFFRWYRRERQRDEEEELAHSIHGYSASQVDIHRI
ncbi:cytochrome C oxidase assembly protein [Paenibacillus xerothermodurans]|uniref:Cytochrome C oxidase assembly protein n=2 Tax=Paenibacillus xerothermodurans TaxID=1977292 RepID=A0A2W1NQ18_PAEXE|nr:cytochrome C oxidase assembly protein [Paenibacillus xerothermodurans]